MKCSNCGETVVDTAKFCPNCGAKIKQSGINVDQNVGSVKGAVTGGIFSEKSIDQGINASIGQKVDTVEESGAVVGAVFGSDESNVHIGGQQSYGDNVQGDKQEIHAGGDYVGGDKVGGDKVGGDKISTGNISGSAVAIGRGASASYQQGLSGEEIKQLFAPLAAAVQQAPPQNQQEAQEKVQQLQEEVAKGDQRDDSRMAKLINGITKLAPSAVGAVLSVFASPALGAIAGPVTQFALEQIRGE